MDEAVDECEYEVEQSYDGNIDEWGLKWGGCEDEDSGANNVSLEDSGSGSKDKWSEGNNDAGDVISDASVNESVTKVKEEQFEIDLPKSWRDFESFLFSFFTHFEKDSEKTKLLDALRSLSVDSVTNIQEFVQNTVTSILSEMVRLFNDSSFEFELNYLPCSTKSLESVRDSHRAMYTFETDEDDIYFRHFVCDDLACILINKVKMLAIVRSVEEQLENIDSSKVRVMVAVETNPTMKTVFDDTCIIKCAPLSMFRKHLIQMKQVFDEEAKVVREQLVKPTFCIMASGISVGNIKQSIYDSSELEGIQKAVDTIASSTTAFCCIDYRESKKNAERISRIVDEICVQFILLESELITANPSLNGNPSDGVSPEKHRLIVATVEALPIIDITSYLRDCGLRIYHITNGMCAIPSENQVEQRTIELLEEKISEAKESDEHESTNMRNCMAFLKGESTKCDNAVREKFKNMAKSELLKSSDLIIGTIDELGNNEILNSGLKRGLKFRTAIINEASRVTQLEMLSLTYLGAQKFILVDNKLEEGSIMHLLMTYYQNNYSTIERGAKCSVVSDWQAPKPENKTDQTKRKRPHGGYRDLKDYNHRSSHRDYRERDRYTDRNRDRGSQRYSQRMDQNHRHYRDSRSPYYNNRSRPGFNRSSQSNNSFPFSPHQAPRQTLLPHPSGYDYSQDPNNQQRFSGQQWNTPGPMGPLNFSPSAANYNHNPRPAFNNFQSHPPTPNVTHRPSNSYMSTPNATNRVHSTYPSPRPSFPTNQVGTSSPQTPASNFPFRPPPQPSMRQSFSVSRGENTYRAAGPPAPRYGTPRPNPTGPHRSRLPYSHR